MMRIYSVHTKWYEDILILLIVICAAVLFLLPAGCSLPLAVGKMSEVVVMADEDVWREIEPEVRGALEREVLSPRHETAFQVIFAPLEKPGEYRKWSKLILIGSLEGRGTIGDLVTEDIRDEINAKRGLLYAASDVWARNQRVFLLVTARERDILPYVRRSKDLLFSKLDDLLRAEVKEKMFLSGPNLALEDTLRDEYGFTMRFPSVYRRGEPLESPRAIRFFNVNPQRSFIIHWEKGEQDSLDPLFVLDLRAELSRHFYPGDYVVAGRTKSEWVDFRGDKALRLEGIWENREKLEGGVFITYAFNCEEAGRFYLLDSILFSPDPRKSKYVYLIQLDTILNSFECSPAAKEAAGGP